ncbi:MAG: MCP four helix bundle domain-containing protein, partial [Candidatus Omnitrophota bacterium]|nr:MCP four helix bundle domain-containing protein [Candidatus Omnitrophota bacterium]
MRISRKIGLSFFITFLLVILLGALSIYSLRHVYKGLDQVFSKELPASRISYQIAISMEDVLSELNNFLITTNENFKINYERSYKDMQSNISRLRGFIVEDEEKALFEKIKELSGDINNISEGIFKGTLESKNLIKKIAKLETKYAENLYKLFDFEENKMLSEKDLLLISAQYIPASRLIIQAKSKLSDMLDGLMQYLLADKGEGYEFFADQFSDLDKYIKDYKNYHGYSLSDKERSISSELLDLSSQIKSLAESAMALKNESGAQTGSLFLKEKEIMDTLDKMINLRKSRISSKLGIGATLTEDIPAVYNISKIEQDISKSWRLSGKYMITGNETYKDSYYLLRQGIEKEFKDYEVHARIRGSGAFLENIVEADKGIAENINSGISVFSGREKGHSDLVLIKSELKKNIGELSARNDLLIKEAKEPDMIFAKLIPGKWALARLDSEISDAERLVVNYLCGQ